MRVNVVIKYIFILPTVLCFIWFVYLQVNSYTFEQGKKGYIYIAVFSACIGAFFGVLWLLTR
jgi:hypothetical protein